MKPILLLLLTCLPLCAATTYPVLSDNTNRTIAGGVTNLSFLNANQTFTGTNTFPAASFYIANNIGSRGLLSTNVNAILTAYTNAIIPTNAGGYANTAGFFYATMPPLLSSNSTIRIYIEFNKTNATTTAATCQVYVGSSTNWVGQAGAINIGVYGIAVSSSVQGLFRNYQGFTSQAFGINSSAAVVAGPVAALVDTSANWPMYIGLTTTGVAIDVHITSVFVEELIRP